MRTVSFSHPQARRLLNRDFICTYTNLEGDPTAGFSIGHQPNEPAGSCIRGNGKQNVQTIYMTPKGKIFHVSTGFLSGKDLVEESNFALELFRDLKSDPDSANETVVESHRKRLAQKGFGTKEIESTNPMASMFQMGMGNQGGFQLQQNRNDGNVTFKPMEGFAKSQFLEDNKFSMRHPMLGWKNLEKDPTILVGNGKSFFASSSSGGNR